MKTGSFLLLIYLAFLMAPPIHSTEECSHHKYEHQEVPATEDHDCCPPFSICKSCSHFIFEKSKDLELEPPGDVIVRKRFDRKRIAYLSVEIPFWQPPKIS